MRLDAKPDAKTIGQRRGVAMLLVMVGLVVCTLLTAGFLSTQGTSIAIARNERDAEECRLLAQAGLDLCYAQMRTLDAARSTADQPSWREKMSPGTWLSNFPIGNGTVTVTAASANGSSFTSDPHQPVIFTSTGFCNNRSFSLTGTFSPTGGGEVFRGGNFFQGNVVVGPGTLLVPTLIDSYNSSSGSYVSPGGSKAIIWTNATQGGSVSINTYGAINGSVVAGPTAMLSNVLNLAASILGLSGGGSVSAATENRDPGTVVAPNLTGLTSQGDYTANVSSLSPGMWNNLNFPNRSGGVLLSSGLFAINGNATLATSAKVSVSNGASTILYIKGNLTLNSSSAITLGTASSLTIYVGGNIQITTATINATGTNPIPSTVQIIGLPNAGNIQITNNARIYGVIYSPNSSVSMQNNMPQIFGAVVAHDISMKDMSQLHFDEAVKSVKIDGIAGGTAPPGAADYTSKVVGTN
ncbi:MAG TPA: hypothetical protein VM008_07275 [Phycisphaerae bacterium]|nr:hypothetical protein [Phycisphaerae bacterium]